PTALSTSTRPSLTPTPSRLITPNATTDPTALIYALQPGLPPPDPAFQTLLAAPQRFSSTTAEIARLYSLAASSSSGPGEPPPPHRVPDPASLRLMFRAAVECLESAAEEVARTSANGKAGQEKVGAVKDAARDVEAVGEVVGKELEEGAALMVEDGMREVVSRGGCSGGRDGRGPAASCVVPGFLR
ncbi:hypothetical protein HDU93_006888, partial [Gonapodya sp. JEL0774]